MEKQNYTVLKGQHIHTINSHILSMPAPNYAQIHNINSHIHGVPAPNTQVHTINSRGMQSYAIT